MTYCRRLSKIHGQRAAASTNNPLGNSTFPGFAGVSGAANQQHTGRIAGTAAVGQVPSLPIGWWALIGTRDYFPDIPSICCAPRLCSGHDSPGRRRIGRKHAHLRFLANTKRNRQGCFRPATWHLGKQWDVPLGLRYTLDTLENPGTKAFGPFDINNIHGLPPHPVSASRRWIASETTRLTYRVGGDS